MTGKEISSRSPISGKKLSLNPCRSSFSRRPISTILKCQKLLISVRIIALTRMWKRDWSLGKKLQYAHRKTVINKTGIMGRHKKLAAPRYRICQEAVKKDLVFQHC